MSPPKYDPIATLGRNIGKELLIKCKRNKKFTGTLKSYDNHLNVLLENVKYTYYVHDEEKDEHVEQTEDIESIILRGDSVVYIGLNNK